MSWTNPNAPNLPDFLIFISTMMQVPVSALPANSPWPGYALDQALNLVPSVPGVPGLEYTLASYNCGGHILLKITPDVPGGNYFATKRGPPPGGFGLLAFSPGVVSSASDEGTSNSLLVPDFMKGLKISDLDFLRTPYGREYLSYCQDMGPAVFGIT